ncbi:hypothetical protein SHKM778_45190 [Streptomyces sp. KM77-8]|uniref:Uncharacterized protein n=1 Tax=Streptomyces haneummycinicus TaxID=3074435 RepID=A0AAT9HKU2_9ACTN
MRGLRRAGVRRADTGTIDRIFFAFLANHSTVPAESRSGYGAAVREGLRVPQRYFRSDTTTGVSQGRRRRIPDSGQSRESADLVRLGVRRFRHAGRRPRHPGIRIVGVVTQVLFVGIAFTVTAVRRTDRLDRKAEASSRSVLGMPLTR